MTDYFEIIIIEIPKVVKAYQKTPNDEVLQWMLFLDNPEKEEVARIMEENKDIKEAKEELERISQDDILRRKALNRTLEIADRLQMKKELKEAKEALKKEKNIGKTEKTHEVVRKMKEANLPIEQIAKIVELKVEEVKAILNEKK
ncbi:MAG: PD-(D/E)XK nuclease family transposase [Clostridia bacterium]